MLDDFDPSCKIDRLPQTGEGGGGQCTEPNPVFEFLTFINRSAVEAVEVTCIKFRKIVTVFPTALGMGRVEPPRRSSAVHAHPPSGGFGDLSPLLLLMVG